MPENSSNKFKEHFGLIPIDPTKNFWVYRKFGGFLFGK